jgi:hypothetical protein
MRGVKDFLRDSLPAMIDYILVVSTPVTDPHSHYPGSSSDRHDRLKVVDSLRQRTVTMPVLDREAIPILPHLLDIPRHLAVVASAVIRNSKDYQAKPNSLEHADKHLDDFCNKCFQVEEHALRRVSQLATRVASDHRRPSIPGSFADPRRESSNSPTSPIPVPGAATRKPGTHQKRPVRKSSRPSTAPSSPDADTSFSRELSVASMPSSPSAKLELSPRSIDLVPQSKGQPSSSPPLSREGTWSRRGQRLLHLKSTSTDGIAVAPNNMADISRGSITDDATEDPSKARKGLLRGILTRR